MNERAVHVAEEIRAEQEHVDRTYARIDVLREAAVSRAADALRLTDSTPASIADREAALSAHGVRRSRFVIGNQSICFGRLDTHEAEIFHIGRLGVTDDEGDPLLVDWRAPIAEAFYRATSSDPRGMARRRHIRMHFRNVVGVDDEPLDREVLTNADEHLVGEGALLAALATPRSGQMGDIVATIQGQQDEAIRASLHGVLVVQGGPGTGKTAVALHRAAYLLYAHELELSNQGVLVVGPNPIFSRYVENVLPGLGETGVRLVTIAELVEGATIGAVEGDDAARIKGAASMVETMQNALAARVRSLEEATSIGFDRWRLEVTPEDSQRIIDEVNAMALPYAQGRNATFRALLTHLTAEVERKSDASARAGQLSRHHFGERATRKRLSTDPDVKALTSRIWPRVTPAQLVDGVLRDLGFAASADARSVHDIALLDEAAVLIGEPPQKASRAKAGPRFDDVMERVLADMDLLPNCPVCGSELSSAGFDWICTKCDPPRAVRSESVLAPVQIQQLNETIARLTETYGTEAPVEERTTWGHVLVDEAQQLTAMQWRMLSRRCPTGSFTIVGDLNQASAASGGQSWTEIAESINPRRDPTLLTLEVNYRTPEEIMALATEVLRAADAPVDPPRSVRSTGEHPTVVTADSFADALAAARAQAEAERAATEAGTIVILVPEDIAPTVGPEVLDERVAEMGVDQARGLEFDSVFVVEPARFATSELYVALTRATARLTLVHSEPLPWVVPPATPAISLAPPAFGLPARAPAGTPPPPA